VDGLGLELSPSAKRLIMKWFYRLYYCVMLIPKSAYTYSKRKWLRMKGEYWL
jgi:hypothetical protein